ncbi:unnamed protein product, partial [Phaeothamnion confervicola]
LGRAAAWVVVQEDFDRFILALILTNALLMAMDEPNTVTPDWRGEVDATFTVCFTTEMVLKLLAVGPPYFADSWNWLDATVVMEGLISLCAGSGASKLKGLRVLRVLRPLRTARRFPRMQMVVSCLFETGLTLGRIILIFVFYIGIFATMGMLLWSGEGLLSGGCCFQS